MAKPQTIVRDGSGMRTATYQLPPGLSQYIESVLVEVDNGAAVDVRPSLQVQTVNGQVMAVKRQGEAIPAGDTGTATWALRLDDSAVASVTSGVIYDYTVTGAAQHTIDTAIDGAMAGAFPTSFVGLTTSFYLRTNAGVIDSDINLVFNNNVGLNYFRESVLAGGGVGTPSAGYSSLTPFVFPCIADAGSNLAYSTHETVLYNYAGTVGGKPMFYTAAATQNLAPNTIWHSQAFFLETANAITRLKIEPVDPTVKFKIGSRVTVVAW